MESRKRRAAQIQSAIHDVLLHDWDPIGVADVDDAPEDEYDSYVGEVYRLLASGASPQKVAEHLSAIERECIGYDTRASDLLPVARKLCELDVRLDPSNGAS